MPACFQILVLLLLPVVVQVCGGSPVTQEGRYMNSLQLTRLARTKVGQLLRIYKEKQLGDERFEDRNLQLKELPSLSTDLQSWLSLEDRERLNQANISLHTYSTMLQWKREQILAEESKAEPSLTDSLHQVQLDLQDLMRRLKTLLNSVSGGKVNQTLQDTQSISLPPHLRNHDNQTFWVRRLEVYVILRDLDLYLTKTARDLLLLLAAARHRGTGAVV